MTPDDGKPSHRRGQTLGRRRGASRAAAAAKPEVTYDGQHEHAAGKAETTPLTVPGRILHRRRRRGTRDAEFEEAETATPCNPSRRGIHGAAAGGGRRAEVEWVGAHGGGRSEA